MHMVTVSNGYSVSESYDLDAPFKERYTSPVKLSIELDQTKALLVQALMRNSPNVPHLQERVQCLAIAVQSQQIIQGLKDRVIKEARAVPKPIGQDMTYYMAMVAQAARSAGNGKVPDGPAPYLGGMSDQQFAEYKRQFGF